MGIGLQGSSATKNVAALRQTSGANKLAETPSKQQIQPNSPNAQELRGLLDDISTKSTEKAKSGSGIEGKNLEKPSQSESKDIMSSIFNSVCEGLGTLVLGVALAPVSIMMGIMGSFSCSAAEDGNSQPEITCDTAKGYRYDASVNDLKDAIENNTLSDGQMYKVGNFFDGYDNIEVTPSLIDKLYPRPEDKQALKEKLENNLNKLNS